MQYVMTFYESPKDFSARDDADAQTYWAGWKAYMEALREAGFPMNGAALESPSTATTVRMKNGARTVEDGPYADTKEQIGGFVILNTASLDEALAWAARCPAAFSGAVEVRPTLDMTADPTHDVALEHSA